MITPSCLVVSFFKVTLLCLFIQVCIGAGITNAVTTTNIENFTNFDKNVVYLATDLNGRSLVPQAERICYKLSDHYSYFAANRAGNGSVTLYYCQEASCTNCAVDKTISNSTSPVTLAFDDRFRTYNFTKLYNTFRNGQSNNLIMRQGGSCSSTSFAYLTEQFYHIPSTSFCSYDYTHTSYKDRFKGVYRRHSLYTNLTHYKRETYKTRSDRYNGRCYSSDLDYTDLSSLGVCINGKTKYSAITRANIVPFALETSAGQVVTALLSWLLVAFGLVSLMM